MKPQARTKPERRALTLLRQHLTVEQKKSLRTKGFFETKGKKKTYKIMLEQCNCGDHCCPTFAHISGICCSAYLPGSQPYSDDYSPWPDQMLAFKLQIEADEQHFLNSLKSEETF